MTTATRVIVSWPIIEASEIDFDNTTPVVCAVPKFVVPVPEFADGGEPLLYPENHEMAGEPVLAWNDKPVGEKGVVFWNAKDHCWQAAACDGTQVIIFNDVAEQQARLLYRKLPDFNGSQGVTLTKFRDFLAQAAAIGLTDLYQSDLQYVRTNMTPVKTDSLVIRFAGITMGFVKRDDHAITLACYENGPFEFVNSAGVTQLMPDGGVIVKLGESIHAIQPDIFTQTYRLASNGRPIRSCSADIARAKPVVNALDCIA